MNMAKIVCGCLFSTSFDYFELTYVHNDFFSIHKDQGFIHRFKVSHIFSQVRSASSSRRGERRK